MQRQGRRAAAVAGMFYEAEPSALRGQVEWCFKHPLGPGSLPEPSRERRRPPRVYIVPHGGYAYCCPVAAHAYAEMARDGRAEVYILVGPNHTGLGAPVSVYPGGSWDTPLGPVPVDERLSAAIAGLGAAELDTEAHRFEHSVEVQLPLLQSVFGSGFSIVAVAMYDQSREAAERLAHAVHRAAAELGRDVTFVATTDLSHYLPASEARERDREVLEAAERLDVDALYEALASGHTMCGVGPMAAALVYAKLTGLTRGRLLSYATSADVAGGEDSVVGYASMVIE